MEVEVKVVPSEEESTPPLPSFGPHPDITKDYNFEDEVAKLPFKFNLGDAPLSKERQDHLLNLVYDHQKVFLLHDEDLGFCNKLAHSIPTMTDKPVYLPHRTIPWHLQGEVRKCLDTWLRQGIIRPSKSPYASQVVIVRIKKRLERSDFVSITGNYILLWSGMLFPYHILMRHFRLSITASGSHLLTWHKAICRCLLRSRHLKYCI